MIDNPETTANVTGFAEILGLGIEELEKFPEKINAVSLDDVKAAYENMTAKSAVVTTVLTPEAAP